MNGYGDSRGVFGFGVDVMTSCHSFQLPAVFFELPREIFSGDSFQTAMSRTLSVAEIGKSLTSTERQPSTAS
jgi:hypothetical protein